MGRQKHMTPTRKDRRELQALADGHVRQGLARLDRHRLLLRHVGDALNPFT